MSGLVEWHDEAERFERTGRLDQGPCWCPRCIDEDHTASAEGGAQ